MYKSLFLWRYAMTYFEDLVVGVWIVFHLFIWRWVWRKNRSKKYFKKQTIVGLLLAYTLLSTLCAGFWHICITKKKKLVSWKYKRCQSAIYIYVKKTHLYSLWSKNCCRKQSSQTERGAQYCSKWRTFSNSLPWKAFIVLHLVVYMRSDRIRGGKKTKKKSSHLHTAGQSQHHRLLVHLIQMCVSVFYHPTSSSEEAGRVNLSNMLYPSCNLKLT